MDSDEISEVSNVNYSDLRRQKDFWRNRASFVYEFPVSVIFPQLWSLLEDEAHGSEAYLKMDVTHLFW